MVLINVYTFLVDQKKIEKNKNKLQDKPQINQVEMNFSTRFCCLGGVTS